MATYDGPEFNGVGGSGANPTFPGPAAPGADVMGGTNPLSGFATRYNADQLKNVWSSPWAILPDVFPGMKTDGAGYQSLRDIGADPLTLYNLMAGQKNDLASQGVGGYTNWLASLFKSMGSVGGRTFSAKELLHALFHPKEGSGGDGGEGQSALYNILTAGDGATQMRTIFNMARDASNVGMNPLAARGYQSALARSGDTAINQMMRTGSATGANNEPIYQLLRQLAPGLVP